MSTINTNEAVPPDFIKTDIIKQRVQQGIYTLFPKENVRSLVWKKFRGIFNECGEEIFGVSCCNSCYTCIRYKTIKNGKIKDFGTRNLKDHILNCGVPRKRGRKERTKDVVMSLPHEIGEIVDFKFHINHQQACQSVDPANSVITVRDFFVIILTRFYLNVFL